MCRGAHAASAAERRERPRAQQTAHARARAQRRRHAAAAGGASSHHNTERERTKSDRLGELAPLGVGVAGGVTVPVQNFTPTLLHSTCGAARGQQTRVSRHGVRRSAARRSYDTGRCSGEAADFAHVLMCCAAQRPWPSSSTVSARLRSTFSRVDLGSGARPLKAKWPMSWFRLRAKEAKYTARESVGDASSAPHAA